MKKERVDNLENKAQEAEKILNGIREELKNLYTDDVEKFLQGFIEKKQNIEKCDKISDTINDWYNDNFIDKDNETGIKTDLESANELAEEFTRELEQQKQEIENIKQNFETNNNNLKNENEKLIEETKQIKENLENELKDLKSWKDLAVGGSLFKSFKETADEYTKKERNSFLISIIPLFCEVGFLIYFLFEKNFDWHNLIISVPIAVAFGFIWWTAKQKSNQYAKSKEEYKHKATSMESFVGYRTQFKENLSDEEYDELFKSTVVVNLTRNPSDELDKILLQKDPTHKFTDILKDGISSIKEIVSKKEQ